MRTHRLDDFTRAYVTAMLWSTTSSNTDHPFDRDYEESDLTYEAIADIVEECAWFQEEYKEHIEYRWRQAGHDFWLTREGHGAGFWDGDWEEPAATVLTDACKPFKENASVWEENGELHYQSRWLDRHREELKRSQNPVINSNRYVDLGDL